MSGVLRFHGSSGDGPWSSAAVLSPSAFCVRERDDGTPAAPTLLGRMREELRLRHRSRRTEEAYLAWVRRFLRFYNRRHPRAMGEDEVTAFLSHLALDPSLRPNLSVSYYEAGHMMYIHRPSLLRLRDELAAFVTSGLER